jgi:hypothetical protein
VVDAIRGQSPKLGAFLDHAEVMRIDGECIELGIDKHSLFHGEVTSRSTLEAIAEAALSVFGTRPRVQFDNREGVGSTAPPSETVFARVKEARLQKERDEIERARAHPVVLEAVRVFGARVKTIELPKTDG